MSRNAKINLTLVIAAAIVWTFVRLATTGGHAPAGPEGTGLDEMVRGFTLKGGVKATRLSPLLPILAWIPFALTGSVASALTVVNTFAMAILVLAACLLMDRHSADARWKAFVALTISLSIMFGKQAAFAPGTPWLCGLAALTLAMALPAKSPTPVAAAQIAAVMALPMGLLAPLYGGVRAARASVAPARAALYSLPAIAVWLAVQWWGRGGVAGMLDDVTPHGMFRTTPMWSEPLFLAPALYFFVTAAGGLSVMACCRPEGWARLWRRAPEAMLFGAAVLACAIVSPPSAAITFGFLLPVWVLLCAQWSGSIESRRAWVWIAAGVLVTFVTQRPWARVDVASSAIDWHPYDAYRGSFGTPPEHLWEVWIPRFLFVAVAAWLLALVSGRHAAAAGATAELDSPREALEPRRADAWPSFLARRALAWSAVDRPAGRWTVVSYVYAAVLAGVTGYFLFGLPIQLTDSFANLLGLQEGSVWQVFKSELGSTSYLRPLLQTQLKIVYELSRGHYFDWFRTVQALQVLAVLLLCVRLLRPRRPVDALMVPCALAIVLGLHTFAGAIREAFPINTFLTLAICCLLAANLARTRGGWFVDAAAAALLAFSLFTLETGVLVWVILVAARVAGERGVSTKGLVIATAVLGSYFAVRAYLHVSVPGFTERSTGFGFAVLDPPDIQARFGRNPVAFYLYNYASALLTVLLAEPRGGVWRFVAGLADRSLAPWQVINVCSSMLTTGVLAWFVARRVPSWTRGSIGGDDYIVLLFLAVLPVNAMLCLVYVKDVIMSPAGVFYALASAVALRELLIRHGRAVPGRMPVVATAVLALISAGWGWRLVGIHYSLRERATAVRSEWAYEDEWEAQNHITIDTPAAIALKRALVDDAMWRRPAPHRLDSRWDPVFDRTQ